MTDFANFPPEVRELVAAAREVVETELGQMACIGSHAPAENALGLLAAAYAKFKGESALATQPECTCAAKDMPFGRCCKMPSVADASCRAAFERWFGLPVEPDADIQTTIAWDNWQAAWSSALAEQCTAADEVPAAWMRTTDVHERCGGNLFTKTRVFPTDIPLYTHPPHPQVNEPPSSLTSGQAKERVKPPTESFVQEVPDHCDRIIWRNRYFHLPIKPQQARVTVTDEMVRIAHAAKLTAIAGLKTPIDPSMIVLDSHGAQATRASIEAVADQLAGGGA